MIAALFVEWGGCYYGVDDVDPWDVQRDARLYEGDYPVVAHPPCQRWGRYALGGPRYYGRFRRGDDGGCFASALRSVRSFGGVLEHPADSHAWGTFGLVRPPRAGGWVRADWVYGLDGWTCHVEQGAYGHPARKPTWLYAVGCELPELAWGRAAGEFAFTTDPPARMKVGREVDVLSRVQRSRTPKLFRDLLVSIAASAQVSA